MLQISSLLPFYRLEEWRAPHQKPLITVLLPLLCYSQMCHTTSVVVEFMYADFILTSFPFIDVELIGREG
jgi:hypothetical protein